MTLLGCQTPRLSAIPDGDHARGELAVEFVKEYQVPQHPWQEELLVDTLRTDSAMKPAVREVIVSLSRQNGKGEYLIALELSAIYLFGVKAILHTAHRMDTAQNAKERLWDVISNNEDLMTWWEDEYPGEPQIVESNGKDAIKFPNGAVIYFRTRSLKTGRGLTMGMVIFDECYNLPTEVFAAINYTTRAVEGALKVFISTPVNRRVHAHGRVFSAKRWSGVDKDPGVLFKEWSPSDGDDPFGMSTWKKTNPSLVDEGPGVQLTELISDANAAKKDADLREAFLVEAIGQGSWYPRDGETSPDSYVIDLQTLQEHSTTTPVPKLGDSCIGLDADPEGEVIGIWSAFRTTAGTHITRAPVDAFDRGAVADLIIRTVRKEDPVAIVYDPQTPIGTIRSLLAKSDIYPEEIRPASLARANVLLTTQLAEGTLTWDGSSQLLDDVKTTTWKAAGRAGKCFDRDQGPIPNLQAASMALWGLETFEIPDIDPAALDEHIPVTIGGVVLEDGTTATSVDEEAMYV